MHAIAKSIIHQIIEAKQQEVGRTEALRQVSIKDTHEAEGAMISRYDTFLEEAQYLAGGQNKRLLEARSVISQLEDLLKKDADVSTEAFVGSVVRIENVDTGEKRSFVLVFDGAGGGTFSSPTAKGEEMMALSISSPIGKSLLRRKAGEEVESVSLPGFWEITEIL